MGRRFTFVCASVILFFSACTASRLSTKQTEITLETRRMKAAPDPDLGLQVYSARELFERADDAYEREAYAEAERLFKRIPREFPESRYKAPTFLMLGTLSLKTEAWASAEVWFKAYLSAFPSGAQGWYAHRGLAAVYAAQNRWAESAAALRKVLSAQNIDADTHDATTLHLARALVEQNYLDEAQTMLSALLQRLGPLARLEDAFPSPSDPIAMGRFYLGEIARRKAEAVRIEQVVDLSRAQARLDEKAAYVLEAHEHYYRTLTYLDPEWTAAAGYRMGYLYERFYQDLMEAPLPPDLDAEDRSLYYEMLDETLANIVLRARKVYDQAVRYADRLDLDPEWVDRCREGLVRLETRPWGPSMRRAARDAVEDEGQIEPEGAYF